ncbi:MAG: GNAT family N-acetyltransferase [Chloroflexi bacterium]|nr:GNAT family N-acetyltransferase [Chloroflexota bacterium]
MTSLEKLRLKIQSLLHFSAPSDALFVYYALYHDPQRTQLYVHEDVKGRTDGFSAVCQTGQRLFQPTVVLRTPSEEAAVELLRQAIMPNRPYYVITTPDLRNAVTRVMDVGEPEVNHVYRLELSRLQHSINVLVVAEQGIGGLPRFVIRSQGETAAESGVSWNSPHFAEVFVRTVPNAQGRGWGRAVLEASTSWVVRSGKQPIYIVNEKNEPSVALAKRVGYVDTGAREFAAEGVGRPHIN